MAGDPPLGQVVARTVEGGLRGHRGAFAWSTGAFRAENADDILFVASDQTGFGYFKNFGRTRRQGLELHARWGRRASSDAPQAGPRLVSVGADYTFLDATFQSRESVNGAGNSTNDEGPGLEGAIEIAPGDRMPLIPRHVLKGFVDVRATRALSVDVDVLAVSSSMARGNENNAHQPDGVYYLGPGQAGGYLVVNLGARYQLRKRVQLFGQIDNLLNTKYVTAAQLGSTGFAATGAFIARPFPPVDGEYPLQGSTFFAPGAPTTGWAGVRVGF